MDLTSLGLKYILGARMKNMPKEIIDKIMVQLVEDGHKFMIDIGDGSRLIVGFSAKRARKDALIRERGLKKLEKALAGGKLTKKHVNNRGYNKYLSMSEDVNITIDYDTYNEDSKWDGLKGYITNTNLQAGQVV